MDDIKALINRVRASCSTPEDPALLLCDAAAKLLEELAHRGTVVDYQLALRAARKLAQPKSVHAPGDVPAGAFGTVFIIEPGMPYPLTITSARYGGVYEGGSWLAFPEDPNTLPAGWDDSDVECMEFWGKTDGHQEYIGRGGTPEFALDDLRLRLNI